jgi:hypothetical protein
VLAHLERFGDDVVPADLGAPAPFGPRKPKNSPWLTVMSTASTARSLP